jgi:hypothetical protein
VNVIVAENGSGRPSWSSGFDFRLHRFDPGLAGFATATSVDRNEPVELKLGSFGGPVMAGLQVWRLGYYGGSGARLVTELPQVPVGPPPAPRFIAPFGLVDCSSWPVTTALPAQVTAVTGVYLVKVSWRDGRGADCDTHIPFIVRDDRRNRDVLVALPTSSWQAYNRWGGKSLYTYASNGPGAGGGEETVAGTGSSGRSRAVKVSFDRPYSNVFADYNWVLRTEWPLIFWLEKMGYDVAYTDDLGLHAQPEQLRRDVTRALVIAGHNEYWTSAAMANVKAARDCGTSVLSFSANTAYWQTRLEESVSGGPGRTLVCFKTVQGVDVAVDGNAEDGGHAGVNDFGPPLLQAARGGPADPLDPALAVADRKRLVTTTFRDAGAAAGDHAPGDAELRGAGRLGPGEPENGLFGVMYAGDDDAVSYPLLVPAGHGSGGEFGAHPAWRHTEVAGERGAAIGANLVGWEWDAMPRGGALAPFLDDQPDGIRRVAETELLPLRGPHSEMQFLTDGGRTYSATPSAGQGSAVQAVTYRAPGGALVFAAGTIQWSWALGPHCATRRDLDGSCLVSYEGPPRDCSAAGPVIQQATCNLLADCGVRPATPAGVVLDDAAAEQPAARLPVTSGPERTGGKPTPSGPPALMAGVTIDSQAGRAVVEVRTIRRTPRTLVGLVRIWAADPAAPLAAEWFLLADPADSTVVRLDLSGPDETGEALQPGTACCTEVRLFDHAGNSSRVVLTVSPAEREERTYRDLAE